MTYSVNKLKQIVLLSLLISPICLSQALFQKGVDYKVLEGQPSSLFQVKEFFSYSCPHCYSFDSTIEGYLKAAPKEYSFTRIPVSFGRKDWGLTADLYTLSELLLLNNKLHHKIFARIHDQNMPFNSDKDVKEFFLNNGVDEERFNKVAKSFSAKSKQKRNELLTKQFKITSVPTLIVRDVYEIDITKINTTEKLNRLVDFLMHL